MIKRIIFLVIPILIVGFIFSLTRDIIFTNILAHLICKTDTRPKTFVKKTVESPGSIYWEDNIYPGFDEADRLLMIRNYLDGVHLKTMALNGPDGKIYLYTATEKDWQTSQAIHAKKKEGNYYEIKAEEAKLIASRGITISRQDLSQMSYKVVFNPIELTSFQRRYLYSDEVAITDNKANEIIAYNRRLMRYYYELQLEPMGGCTSMTKLHFEAIYGLPILYGLDDESILKYMKPSNIVTNYKCRRSLKAKD